MLNIDRTTTEHTKLHEKVLGTCSFFHSRIFIACTLFVLTVVYLYFSGKGKSFVYDGMWYFTIGDKVFENGINIYNFPETFRGYLFPVIMSGLKKIVASIGINQNWAWFVLASSMLSAIFVYLLPALFGRRKRYIDNREIIGCFVAIALFLFFWGDFLFYPLSDLTACFFLLFAVDLLNLLYKSQSKILVRIAAGFFAGVCIYAAYNTRVTYVYGALIAFIIYMVIEITERKIKRLLISAVTIIVGCLILAVPQMMINNKYIGQPSPKVYTEQLDNYSNDLQMQQVRWGLQIPRYETYAGSTELYPSPSVVFDDPVGSEIIDREGINGKPFTIRTLLQLLLKYPLDFLGLYSRHLISLLTPIYKQVYIDNLFVDKSFNIVFGVFLWLLLAVAFVIIKPIKKSNIIKCLNVIAVCFPAFLQAVGAPELRFFLLMYLVLYHSVGTEIKYRLLFARLKKKWLQTLAVCAVVFILWLSVVGSILGYNREKTLLINDNGVSGGRYRTVKYQDTR